MRPLRDHQWLNMQDGLLLQSLQKSSGSNPCSNIPGQGTGVCSRKVAGNNARSPPAVPKLVMADMRPLGDQQWQNMQDGLLFQSLQKGQGKSSGSNPCSNIPGQGTGVCTRKVAGNSVLPTGAVVSIQSMRQHPRAGHWRLHQEIAGNVVRAPPAVPNLVMDVSGASSIASETNKQHPTS
ncbi:hypothetical protein GH714_036607 [Hevea brasiliensis]|uniref:Uncharacterized protein n=1 Tax=Hevea brasiliensis TaxID=3981 RepID=A0A6A6LN85_HEVBR|nr:hypothetical protein GH714_036607 [Hevea brasiliensis]